MDNANKLVLDFSENPDLQAALGGKEPGDRVKLEVTVMVTSVDDTKFEGSIEEISSDSEEQEAPSKVSSDEPVMMVMMKKAGKSKGYAKKDAPADDEEGDEIA